MAIKRGGRSLKSLTHSGGAVPDSHRVPCSFGRRELTSREAEHPNQFERVSYFGRRGGVKTPEQMDGQGIARIGEFGYAPSADFWSARTHSCLGCLDATLAYP